MNIYCNLSTKELKEKYDEFAKRLDREHLYLADLMNEIAEILKERKEN